MLLQAARRAAAVPCTRRLRLPARDLYSAADAFVRRQWQCKWEAQRGNKLKELKPSLGPWTSSFRRNRREEVILCRLRIGHTYGTHGHLLRGEERPLCPRCLTPLTVAHVLLTCPHLCRSRTRHFGGISSNPSLRRLLGDDSEWVHSGSLFSFISGTKLSVIYSPQ